MVEWTFEADYFTACNCDWGCPCNFNARPTEGRCLGWGAWRIVSGRVESTPLDGTRVALSYRFPGPREHGQGTACAYVDAAGNPEQRRALEAIATGKAGGGIFELFATVLTSRWLTTKFVPIAFDVADGTGRVAVDGFGEGETALLSYPDGTVIRPWVDLPHGIEYKKGLMTDARRWWWRDEDLLATYTNRYGAVARVKFTQDGCIG